MKKIIMASMLLSGISLFAGEYFVGANLSSADTGIKISGTVTINSTTYSAGYKDSDRDTNLNAKFGYIDNSARYYIQTGKLFDKGTTEYKSTTINYDRLLNKTVSGFIPFVGLHIGRGEGKIYGLKDTGNEYGIQAGILNNINDKAQFEAGVRHTFTSAKLTASQSGTYVGHTYSVNGELSSDDVTALYVGLNYKF